MLLKVVLQIQDASKLEISSDKKDLFQGKELFISILRQAQKQ